VARHDERGAVVPLVAILLTTLLGITALTVDIGIQRVARADMQALADMVALDLARELDGRAASAIEPGLQAAADRSLARNADTAGDAAEVEAELGTLDGATFVPVGGATVPDAVRVSATTSVDFSFRPGSGGAGRTALAAARAQGCYKLGSWGARLATASDANLVYRTLAAHGIGAAVTASTYQGLVGAHVDLADLAAALGLASPEALATSTVSLSTLLTAAATVIGSNGSSAGQVAALGVIRASVGSLGSRPVSLASLVSVATGAGSGLAATVDLGDLVVGSVLVADGNAAVSIPTLTSGVPNLASVSSSLTLVQAARTACGFAGSTPNASNQVSLTTSGTLSSGVSVLTSLVSGIAGLAGITVSPLSGHPVSLSVSTAAATSTLDAITCDESSRSVVVATSGGLLAATLTVPVSVKVTTVLNPLGTTVTGTITATLTANGTPGSVTITVPTQRYATPYSNGGSQVQLSTPAVDSPSITVGGLTLVQAKAVLDAVAGAVVTPMVTALNSSVVGPLSDVAGLRTAGADVLLLDHPTCSTPALRG
jgi:hypothetical protein